MEIKISEYLKGFVNENYNIGSEDIVSKIPNIMLETEKVKAIMINEVAANNLEDDFYSDAVSPAYLDTTIPLFHQAGADVKNIRDILEMGIYVTNAVKVPKTEYTIETSLIKSHMPILEKEISLFPNLKVIMLMGDVAKKSFNMMTKKEIKKNVVPAISTYKIRSTEIYYNDIRILPSYIMTGKNILIEKSKFQMASEDINKMIEIIYS